MVVLIAHFGTFVDHLPFQRVMLGRMGVDFFFVLSGLLMSNILFVKRTPLKIFYQRRFSRIAPVFVTYLTLVYIGGWLFKQADESSNFLYSLFFVRSYLPAKPNIWQSDLPVGHLWSLNVEEHAYVFLTLITLIAALRYREYVLLFGFAFIAIVTRYIYVRYPELGGTHFELRTETAIAPLLLSAGYFLIRDRFVPWVSSWMPGLAIALGVLCYSDYAPWYASWTVAPFAFSFAVCHIQQSRALTALLSSKLLRLLGIWSYSLYLWQQPFSKLYATGTLQFYGHSVVWLALSLGTGLLSFYFLENPIRRILNDRWEARRVDRAVSA